MIPDQYFYNLHVNWSSSDPSPEMAVTSRGPGATYLWLARKEGMDPGFRVSGFGFRV